MIRIGCCLILIAAAWFAVPVFAENTYIIPDPSKEIHGQISKELQQLKSRDKYWNGRIKNAKTIMEKTITVSGKKFSELDYFEKCGCRLRMWITGLRKIQSQVENELIHLIKYQPLVQHSKETFTEIKGIQLMLNHVTASTESSFNNDPLQQARLKIINLTYQSILARMNRQAEDDEPQKLTATLVFLDGELKKYVKEYYKLKYKFEEKYG